MIIFIIFFNISVWTLVSVHACKIQQFIYLFNEFADYCKWMYDLILLRSFKTELIYSIEFLLVTNQFCGGLVYGI